jgi:hypothetical protein
MEIGAAQRSYPRATNPGCRALIETELVPNALLSQTLLSATPSDHIPVSIHSTPFYLPSNPFEKRLGESRPTFPESLACIRSLEKERPQITMAAVAPGVQRVQIRPFTVVASPSISRVFNVRKGLALPHRKPLQPVSALPELFLGALDIDWSDPDTQIGAFGAFLGVAVGIGAPIFYISRDERDEERLEELRALNRATKATTGEYLTEVRSSVCVPQSAPQQLNWSAKDVWPPCCCHHTAAAVACSGNACLHTSDSCICLHCYRKRFARSVFHGGLTGESLLVSADRLIPGSKRCKLGARPSFYNSDSCTQCQCACPFCVIADDD